MCAPQSIQSGVIAGGGGLPGDRRREIPLPWASSSDSQAGASSTLAVPEAATTSLPAQASDSAMARINLPGDSRRIPTLPAQASDVARRAVAGEMKGKGNNNAGGSSGGSGGGSGAKPADTTFFSRRGRPMAAGATGTRRRRSNGIGTFSGLIIPSAG